MKKIIEKYRKKGFKLTPQRLAILKFLSGNEDHPTAMEIFYAIRVEYPTVSFATIYNTLNTLKEKGDLQEITIDPQKKHYDPNPESHHHVMCTRCNRIWDVFKDYSHLLSLPENIRLIFNVTGNHVDFYGLCMECQNKKQEEV